MFTKMCSSFCSIVTCLFESILMPKLLMQECYEMLGAVSLQSMSICHFCYICCVMHMGMSFTCVLFYAMPYLQGRMPCIFAIFVVTSTSMQSSSHDTADILMPCKHDATERSMHILRYFSKGVLKIWLCSIHACAWLQL